MRWIAVLGLVVAAAGLAFSVRQLDTRGRPADVAFALLAPVAAVLALLALAAIFIPGFLG